MPRTPRASGCPSSSPYSFIAEPQPAALTTTWSKPAPQRARTPRSSPRRARRAASSAPACSSSAPQQSGTRGASDLEALGGQRRGPSRGGPGGRRRAARSPSSRPTRPRCSPDRRRCARAVSGRSRRAAARGARPWRARDSAPGSALDAELAAPRPASGASARSRSGWGSVSNSSRRSARSPRGALVVALDLGTDALDQPVVADARRARGHARHAAQAAVEVRRPSRPRARASGSRPSPISTIRPRGESASCAPQDVGRAACPGRSRSGRSRRSPTARAGGARRTPAMLRSRPRTAGVAGRRPGRSAA